MSYSVKAAAELAGVPEKTFRMHIIREKVKVTRAGSKVTITEDDLHAYMLTEGLMDTAAAVQGKPADEIYQRLNTTLTALPQHVKDAILQGMPKMGRGGMSAGDPEPVRKALGLPKAGKATVEKPEQKLLTAGDDEIEEADF